MRVSSAATRSRSASRMSPSRCAGAKPWPSLSPEASGPEAMEAPLMHLALVGTPNSGKTSLFNALTGSRQKVANYPGVTVERKEGSFVTPRGRQVSVVDLPGTYSLRGRLHQSALDHSTGARTQAYRPAADAGAQHVRYRHPARRQRRCGAAV